MRSIIAFFKSLISTLLAIFRTRTPGPVIIDEPPGNEVVCYYGCPNSKKAQKLQLNKTLYK